MNTLLLSTPAHANLSCDATLPRLASAGQDVDLTGPLLRALDWLAVGIAVIDESDRVRYVNSSCRSALFRESWWRSELPEATRQTVTDGRWRTALEEVRRLGRRRLLAIQGAGLRDGNPIGEFVALSPLPLNGRGLVLVTLGRSSLCGALELQLFASKHGLTEAEGRVMAMLAAGMRPRDIARQNHVAVSTICTQVVAIRGKTACASVLDLLFTLSRLPPVRPIPC